MLFQMLAIMNENALRGMVEKNAAVYGKRKERGDHVGRAPYGYQHAMIDGVSTLVPRDGEDPARIVAAFGAAGSEPGDTLTA